MKEEIERWGLKEFKEVINKIFGDKLTEEMSDDEKAWKYLDEDEGEK